MSKHKSSTTHTNLELFFQKIQKKKLNTSQQPLEEVDEQLEMMLIEAKERGYSQQ